MIDTRPFITNNTGDYAYTNLRTPWAVQCLHCGLVHMTKSEYNRQMNNPNAFWQCPKCGSSGQWSDNEYDLFVEANEQ